MTRPCKRNEPGGTTEIAQQSAAPNGEREGSPLFGAGEGA